MSDAICPFRKWPALGKSIAFFTKETTLLSSKVARSLPPTEVFWHWPAFAFSVCCDFFFSSFFVLLFLGQPQSKFKEPSFFFKLYSGVGLPSKLLGVWARMKKLSHVKCILCIVFSCFRNCFCWVFWTETLANTLETPLLRKTASASKKECASWQDNYFSQEQKITLEKGTGLPEH